MSRASKIFFGSTVAFMGATIYGVHWLQQRESDVSVAGSISRTSLRGMVEATALLK